MVKIDFTRPADVPVRFARSPLWETVACVRLVARGRGAGLPQVDVRQIPTLAALLDREHPYLPDCLAPPPIEPRPSFADELARMRETPPAVVAGELARMHPRRERSPGIDILARYGGHPDRVMEMITAELEAVWVGAVQAWWPRLDAILEADIVTRGRRLAESGLGTVFSDFSGVHLDARRMTVRTRCERPDARVDRELLLVPSVLGAPDIFAVVDAPWPLSVYYPARGAGEIWETEPAGDWLETFAGRTRVRILKCVREPSTTSQVAARVRLAPASVSHHLQRLRRAGLVHRTRAGAQVVYALTGRGKQLLALSR